MKGDELPNFPDPLDPNGTDDWALWVAFTTGTNGDPIQTSLESKAKRKIGKDEALYTIMHVSSVAGSNITFGCLGRNLFRWKT